jgi:hypothetical protein
VEWPSERFVDEVKRYASFIRPDWDPPDVLSTYVARYEFAQTVCALGFYAKLPPMTTSIGGFFIADTAYYYPEDRSISESIRVGRQLAETAINHAA